MFIKSKNKNILGLNDFEFEFFLSKFYGTLISKGKKGHAIKLFNKILVNFKNKFKKDPFIELRKAIDNLIPILISTQKRIGKVYQAVPRLAIGNKRFVIMLSWIIKKQKGKTNVIGLKIDDVSKYLIDAVDNKGVLINLKKQNLSMALANKHLLYANRRRSYFKWQRIKPIKKFTNRKFFYKLHYYKYGKKRYKFLRKNKLLLRIGEIVKNNG